MTPQAERLRLDKDVAARVTEQAAVEQEAKLEAQVRETKKRELVIKGSAELRALQQLIDVRLSVL